MVPIAAARWSFTKQSSRYACLIRTTRPWRATCLLYTSQRGLLGFPLGIAIGFVITVIISMCIGDGSFYPVTPELIDTMKNELNAVILQTILCGILGTGFAMASVIWEIDSWSLAKQSGIYFSIACRCV